MMHEADSHPHGTEIPPHLLAPLTNGESIMDPAGRIEAPKQALRLLIPVTASEGSRWGVSYALRLAGKGQRVEVCFLNVGEIITQWQVLRFRTQAEIAKFQSERAQTFIDEAARPLVTHNIPFRGVFKRGDPVFCIPDAAEELDCDQIVMPSPNSGLCSFFSRNIVAAVARRSHVVPVVTIDSNGTPSDAG
jgi:nucleotide-binding universal stress UspA family protein